MKWKGYTEDYNTWEPIENLGGFPEMLEEFEKILKEEDRKNDLKRKFE